MCHDAGVRLNEAAACLCKTLWLRRAGLFDSMWSVSAWKESIHLVVARCRAGVNVDGSRARGFWRQLATFLILTWEVCVLARSRSFCKLGRQCARGRTKNAAPLVPSASEVESACGWVTGSRLAGLGRLEGALRRCESPRWKPWSTPH